MDDEKSTNVELHPKWRLLVHKIEEKGLTYGDIMEHAWINEVLGLDYSSPTLTYSKGQKLDLKRLGYIEDAKEYLLIEKNMALRSMQSVGYLIVTPQEQTEWAEDDMDEKISKILKKTASRMKHLDRSKLNSEEIEDNIRAMTRVAGIKRLVTGRDMFEGTSFERLTDRSES